MRKLENKSDDGIIRHVLSLSGGKDSAALVFHMRDHRDAIWPVLELVFNDTGSELPETYEYLERVAELAGKEVVRTNSEGNAFKEKLEQYGGYLPSPWARWCTRELKIRPFERYVAGADMVYQYIGIRADEDHRGVDPHKNIVPVYPFVEDGIDFDGVLQILHSSGLGLPGYLKWGRSRSGCYFCFFQRQHEWVALKQEHPELYAKAQQIEEEDGQNFTWRPSGESLAELGTPARMEEVMNRHQQRERRRAERIADLKAQGYLFPELKAARLSKLRENEGCLICFK